ELEPRRASGPSVALCRERKRGSEGGSRDGQNMAFFGLILRLWERKLVECHGAGTAPRDGTHCWYAASGPDRRVSSVPWQARKISPNFVANMATFCAHQTPML